MLTYFEMAPAVGG